MYVSFPNLLVEPETWKVPKQRTVILANSTMSHNVEMGRNYSFYTDLNYLRLCKFCSDFQRCRRVESVVALSGKWEVDFALYKNLSRNSFLIRFMKASTDA